MDAMLESVASMPLWQQVAGVIRRAIRAGQLRPGDRVVEAQLARQLGISRNPIREALRQLQQQGILEYRPNAGTIVAKVAAADAQVALEMRAFLEARAVRLVLEAGADGRLERLEQLVAQMANLSPEAPIARAEELDAQFHDHLLTACGSPMLRRVWETVDPYTWMIMVAWQRRSPDYQLDYRGLYEDHQQLLNTLRAGEAAPAEAAVWNHIMRRWQDVKREM